MSGIQARDDTPSMEEQFGEIPAMPIEELTCEHCKGMRLPNGTCLRCTLIARTADGPDGWVWRIAGFKDGVFTEDAEKAERMRRKDVFVSAVQILPHHIPSRPIVSTAADTKWKRAFAAQSRKLERVLHLPGVKEALAELTWPEGDPAAAEQREAAAREQIAAVERENSRLLNVIAGKPGGDAFLDALSSAQETISRMTEALKPFADFADSFTVGHPGWDHDGFLVSNLMPHELTLAPFRAARAALTLARETNDGQ